MINFLEMVKKQEEKEKAIVDPKESIMKKMLLLQDKINELEPQLANKEDEEQITITLFELNAAKTAYYVLFSELRVLHGLPPFNLEKKLNMFTGGYRYDSSMLEMYR